MSENQEKYKEEFYDAIEGVFRKLLKDNSDDNIVEAFKDLDDRMEECEVQDVCNLVAQAAIVVGLLNEEPVFAEE